MKRETQVYKKKRNRGKRKRDREIFPRGRQEGGGKVDRGLSHYACSEETTGLDTGTAAIDS